MDPEARHGHKTCVRGFDGYKGHLAIDPDAEIITATTVTAANSGDADPAEDLLGSDLPAPVGEGSRNDDGEDSIGAENAEGQDDAAASCDAGQVDSKNDAAQQLAVYGDAAYGAGKLLATLESAGAQIMTKVQPPTAPGGRFAKDRFTIDLTAGSVTCPGQVSVSIRAAKGGGSAAAFGSACAACSVAAQCTSSATGRTITISAYEAQLARARATQTDPTWRADYTATRPKVERKIAHLMRHRHGGRRARVRGTTKVGADFSLLAATANLARLGVLGLRHAAHQGWQVAPA